MKGKSVLFLAVGLGFVLATVVFSQGITKAQSTDAASTEVTNAVINNTEMNAVTNAVTNAETNTTSNEAAPTK